MPYLVSFFLVLIALGLQAQDFPLEPIYTKNSFAIGLKDQPVFIEFPSQRPFLKIAKHQAKVKYKYASYHFKEKKKVSCEQPKIDSTKKQADYLELQGHFEDCDCRFSLRFANEQVDKNGPLKMQVQLSDGSYNRIFLTYKSNSKEHFYGFGQQYSHLDLKGKKPVLFSEESGIGRGDKPITKWSKLFGVAGNEYTTHIAIPFYINIEEAKDYYKAFWLENTAFSRFDLTDPNWAVLELWDNQLKAQLWQTQEPLDLIEQYTAKIGRFAELPDWAYGTWLGLQGGSEKAERLVEEAKRAKNPLTAVWLQDWVGKRKTRVGSQLWWRWEFDSVAYPDFKHFCTKMNEQGVKVLGYINPFLANEGKMIEQAMEKDYLVKNPKGEAYKIKTAGFPAYLVDLTNPEAYNWLKEIIKTNMIGSGLSGWMADYAEGLPWDAKLHSGVDPKIYHNQYPIDFARLNRQAIREAGKEGEIVFFTRSGHSRSPQHSTLFWMGDQLVTWGKNDGLPSTIPAALSSGISGISLNHSDIGGYTTINFAFVKKQLRDQELLFRWAELNAFFPVFRTHEGLKPEKNYQVYSDSASVDFFSKMGQLHYGLKDYFQFLVQQANQKGYPLLRPLFLHYPQDANTYDLAYQFLLGEDLLVLPVIESAKTSVKGYLPEGNWKHIWTGRVWKGGENISVEAPIGQPAAFIRIGGDWEERLEKVFEPLRKGD